MLELLILFKWRSSLEEHLRAWKILLFSWRNFLNYKAIWFFLGVVDQNDLNFFGSNNQAGIDNFLGVFFVVFNFLGKFIKVSLDLVQFYHKGSFVRLDSLNNISLHLSNCACFILFEGGFRAIWRRLLFCFFGVTFKGKAFASLSLINAGCIYLCILESRPESKLAFLFAIHAAILNFASSPRFLSLHFLLEPGFLTLCFPLEPSFLPLCFLFESSFFLCYWLPNQSSTVSWLLSCSFLFVHRAHVLVIILPSTLYFPTDPLIRYFTRGGQ